MAEEKTEPATEHKREEARKRGQVLKSQDAVVAAVVIVFALSINALGPFWYRNLYGFFVETLENIPFNAHLDFGEALHLLGKALVVVALCVAPIAALAFFTSWLANVLQVGVLVSFKPMAF
ncbi:MAG: EscU/YscU/HrcU family type III secretion system export apparatus switch protein, partial [Cyanobacteria bacterium REEB65]|nr:EscU/YscU/HrcU family type III secretion system export apparatus switch protein [Cyanobacteria bacterium REEB65]